jgi:mutator protein MutT
LNPDELSSVVHVVAAAVIDAAGRVLIAQRPPCKHLAGAWEFPGGKLEAGEDRRVGLARELHEELGIAISTPRPLMRINHTYPTGAVLLDIFVVRHYTGEPRGLDGQALRWCSPAQLEEAALLAADKPIVAMLRLPERLTEMSTPAYLIGNGGRPVSAARLIGQLCSTQAEATASEGVGADFVVLTRTVSANEIANLCESTSVPVFVRGVALEQAWALGASGISDIDHGIAKHG